MSSFPILQPISVVNHLHAKTANANNNNNYIITSSCSSNSKQLPKRKNSFQHRRYPYALFATGLGTSGQLGIGKPDEYAATTENNSATATATTTSTTTTTMNNFDMDQVNTPVGIPHSVFNYERLTSVESGWYHSVVLTESGSMYTCGAGYSHQSGHHYTTNIRFFKKLATRNYIKGPVKQVSCGGHHTLCLTELGTVYAFGEGREGQLGSGEKRASSCPIEIQVFEEVTVAVEKPRSSSHSHSRSSGHKQSEAHYSYKRELVPVRFIQVSAGGYHSLLIDEKNRVWSFGKNSYGQLGLSSVTEILQQQNNNQGNATEERKSSNGNSKQQQASSSSSTFNIMQQYGKLLQHHQAGLSKTSSSPSSAISGSSSSTSSVQPATTNNFEIEYVLKPAMITHVSKQGKSIKTDKMKFISTAAGAWHTIFLTDNGECYGCGDTQYGQIGVVQSNSRSGYSSATLSSAYNSGDTTSSSTMQQQQAVSNVKSKFQIPEFIEHLAPYKIKSIACGYFHSVFIDTCGRLFTCGWAAYGQTGLGSSVTERLPMQVVQLKHIPIHSAACGWNHVIAIDKKGICYGFGEAKHGQLGRDFSKPLQNNQQMLAQQTHQQQQRRQLELPEQIYTITESVRKVAAGRGHSLFLVGEIEHQAQPYQFSASSFTDLIIQCR